MAAFSPEPIFSIGSFAFTNTLLDTLIVDAVIVAGVVGLSKKLSYIPSGMQNIVEIVVEGFYGLIESISPKHATRIFPWVTTFFIFIILTNWSGLIPGFGTIGFYQTLDGHREFVPLLRAATSDINLTLGLALLSAVVTHAMSIDILGIQEYLKRYFSFNPIYLFVGLLELVGELTKVVSLSFRLFGNIFAGEVVLKTISGLFAFIAPLPFMALEIIVGLVQALVFSMLTMTFMAILTTPHHEETEMHESKEVR